jgi:hypothetical protein
MCVTAETNEGGLEWGDLLLLVFVAATLIGNICFEESGNTTIEESGTGLKSSRAPDPLEAKLNPAATHGTHTEPTKARGNDEILNSLYREPYVEPFWKK